MQGHAPGESAAEFVWPRIRAVAPGALHRWLRAGIADLRALRALSLFYGAVLALMGHLLQRNASGATGLALMTGFLLVGPFLACGLYDLSRRRAAGRPARLEPTLVAWRANLPALSFFAVALTLLLAAWLRISVVVVALFFPEGQIAWSDPATLGFAAAYLAAGGAFALFVFGCSGLALPLLLLRPDMDPISAAITSFTALRRHLPLMLSWGLFIVATTAVGFATLGLGLIITIPLVGHMTWHACCEIIDAHPANTAQDSSPET